MRASKAFKKAFTRGFPTRAHHEQDLQYPLLTSDLCHRLGARTLRTLPSGTPIFSPISRQDSLRRIRGKHVTGSYPWLYVCSLSKLSTFAAAHLRLGPLGVAEGVFLLYV